MSNPTVSPKDESQQLVDRKEIIISRKEEYPLRVIFAPKSVVNFGAKLVIKTLSGVRRKFSIPLLGYGGSAVLGLEAERGGGGGLMSKERFLNVYGRGKRGGCADFMSDETSWVMPLSGEELDKIGSRSFLFESVSKILTTPSGAW